MNAITAAATAAKSTIDRLLSNGKASAASGLVKYDPHYIWTYSERFGCLEISVDYRRNGKEWEYRVVTNDLDSAFFFGKTGTARTLKEARLEALDAVVAGCAAQPGKAESGAKKKLLSVMQGSKSCYVTIRTAIQSGLLPDAVIYPWMFQLVTQSICRALGRSGCHDWEDWATNYLSGKDRSELAALAAVKAVYTSREFSAAEVAARAAVEAARGRERAAEVAFWAAGMATTAKEVRAESERQHRTLLALINTLPDKD